MNFDPDYDLIFKMLLVGSTSVGKSSLLSRLCNNHFPDNFIPTVGVDFKIKTFEIEDTTVKLQIWDTAGQERFKTITSSYYKGAHGVMLVFDLSNKASFEEIDSWIDEVERNSNSVVILYLIGNKADLVDSREVSAESAQEYAKLNNMIYMETSAKTFTNVLSSFEDMAKRIRDKTFNEKGITIDKLKEMKQEKAILKSKTLVKFESSNKGCC